MRRRHRLLGEGRGRLRVLRVRGAVSVHQSVGLGRGHGNLLDLLMRVRGIELLRCEGGLLLDGVARARVHTVRMTGRCAPDRRLLLLLLLLLGGRWIWSISALRRAWAFSAALWLGRRIHFGFWVGRKKEKPV